ncbi:M20/M25/M40 family metallo-hydrolase [Sphingomonas sp. XMGL2]|uniref:M20/M25/M40 family metallo-hydrolase n=1 Tax=Sphingomonas quercus TaxID=2842451 RepID=A0ABS6BHF4_9SPHN|nr:M20/M25/M40 family metallo-hydrolase [Sphingomonas quercus]
MARIGIAAAMLAVTGVAQAQSPAQMRVIRTIEVRPAFKAALAELDREHPRWIENIVTLTEIPAPPFKEAERGKAYADMFRKLGLEVSIDEVGNVLGLRRGTQPGGKAIVVSAHLDTVFPEGTPTKVRREGDKLFAAGVGDDSTGLATQLSLINAMNAADIRTPSDILFVGTVGEEGLGDLRGVRHLFTQGAYKDRIAAFFSLDGNSTDEFTIGGVGSKRYRLTFTGPGGHSFGAFGLVNPMTALGQTITDLYKVQVPASPKTTYSASVVGGGTSINAIPREAWLEVDMRSESAAELARLERQFLDIVGRAVAGENAARSTAEGPVKVDIKLVGDRPAGATPRDADIVGFTTAAYASAGITPRYSSSSTDSNVPMSLGIPAITIARSAQGGRSHSLDEWVGTTREPALRILRLDLLSVLAVAGYR